MINTTDTSTRESDLQQYESDRIPSNEGIEISGLIT